MGGGMGGMGGMGGGNIIINQVDMDVNVVGGNMVNTEVEVGQQPMGNMNMMNSGMGQQPMGGNMMNGMGMNGMGQQHLMGGNMPMMNGMGQQGNMMNGMGMNGMGRGNMMNGMGMNGMGRGNMMNGMGMNGMGRGNMMNGMGMNGMGRGNMMNGMGMNGMGRGNMMNGMGMNGMGPQMNGMGQQMNGMGQHNPQMMNQQMYGQQQPYRPYGRTRGLPDGEEGAEGDDAAEVQAEVAALRADSENTGPLITDEQLLAEFKLLDVNLNGYLEKDEFLEVYKKYDPLYEECEGTIHKMLQGYNMMGDDKVSYDEFCLIMLKLAQK